MSILHIRLAMALRAASMTISTFRCGPFVDWSEEALNRLHSWCRYGVETRLHRAADKLDPRPASEWVADRDRKTPT